MFIKRKDEFILAGTKTDEAVSKLDAGVYNKLLDPPLDLELPPLDLEKLCNTLEEVIVGVGGVYPENAFEVSADINAPVLLSLITFS